LESLRVSANHPHKTAIVATIVGSGDGQVDNAVAIHVSGRKSPTDAFTVLEIGAVEANVICPALN
jgi:hypothetical protein